MPSSPSTFKTPGPLVPEPDWVQAMVSRHVGLNLDFALGFWQARKQVDPRPDLWVPAHGRYRLRPLTTSRET